MEVESVHVKNLDDDTSMDLPAGAVIICGKRIPNSELGIQIGCEIDKNGYIIVDREQKTAIERVFAAGDVAGVVHSAIKSAGEGCVAGLKTAEYLETGSW